MGFIARLFPVLLVLSVALAQYEDDYAYGYDFYDGAEYAGAYGDGGDTSLGLGATDGTLNNAEDDFYYDEYGYYGDEDEQYYEYYGYYADDFAGYEDYYTDEYETAEDCFFDANGKPVLSNGTASCDIKISGVDKQADKLTGGLDGVYQLISCFNGRPMYQRKKSPEGEDRVLWYSSTFGDWDVSKGQDPNEAEILMYGGEMEHASVPLFVDSWHLGGDLKSDTATGEDDYLPVSVKIACADGKVFEEPEQQSQRIGPVLTDAEMEAKYRYIYDKYSRSSEPSPTINFTFVVLLVMTGLTIVLAIPYFLLKKKGGASGKGPAVSGSPSISTSFAQMLTQSKKKQSGHIN